MEGVLDHRLIPIIGRQFDAPNIPWLIQCDAAMPGTVGIDVDDASLGTHFCQHNVNRNFHSNP